MRRVRGGSGSVLLAAVLVAIVSAGPVTARSPSASPSPLAPAERPMLASEGWMYATVEARRAGRTRLDVVAVSPTGDVRLVSTIEDLTNDRAGRDLHKVDEVGQTIATVTTDGFLPVPLEWSEADGDRTVVRVFDLLAPQPVASVVEIAMPPDEPYAWDSLRSGADGRLSMRETDEVLVLDPATGTRRTVAGPDGRWSFWEGDWLARSTGWWAAHRNARGVLTVEGEFIPRPRSVPPLDLARGAHQVSSARRTLGTWDTGSSGPAGFVRPEECRSWWSFDAHHRVRRVWWDRCRDLGRVHDIRWDVDQKGVLVGRGDRIELVRRDRPRVERRLISLPAARFEYYPLSEQRIEVLGLAPGPRRGELLIALRPADNRESVFFLSTIEQELIEIRGSRDHDSIDFAGFATPPSDRDMSGLMPVALRPDETPAGMLAPTDWLFAWVGSRSLTGPLRVIAMSDEGEVRDVAVVRPGRPIAEDAASAMRVTTTGYLPIPTRDIDGEDGTTDRLEVFDLRRPAAPPLTLVDEPGMVHGWRSTTSAATGLLSIPVSDGVDPWSAMRIVALPSGTDQLVPIPAEVFVGTEPVASGDGWPAWRVERSRLVLLLDGTTAGDRRRTVSLARGAVQMQWRSDRLERIMGDADLGVLRGCGHDRIVSGRDRLPDRLWWDPCRDAGRLVDIRWDTDGYGVLYLVRRGERLVFGRSPNPGVQEPIASFPISAIGGRRALQGGFRVMAVMDGRLVGEFRVALATHRDLWLWSTMRGDPVPVPRANGEITGFAGFSVPPGDPR